MFWPSDFFKYFNEIKNSYKICYSILNTRLARPAKDDKDE